MHCNNIQFNKKSLQWPNDGHRFIIFLLILIRFQLWESAVANYLGNCVANYLAKCAANCVAKYVAKYEANCVANM